MLPLVAMQDRVISTAIEWVKLMVGMEVVDIKMGLLTNLLDGTSRNRIMVNKEGILAVKVGLNKTEEDNLMEMDGASLIKEVHGILSLAKGILEAMVSSMKAHLYKLTTF